MSGSLYPDTTRDLQHLVTETLTMQHSSHETIIKDCVETMPNTRRDFLVNTGKVALLMSMGMFGAGCEAVNQGLFGRGMMPIALDNLQAAGLPKTDMLVHTKNPFNGEFTPHLLNDDVTPTERHFVRNNSGIPKRAIEKDRNGWKLVIDGEVHKELTLSMDDLQRFHRSLMKLYWNVRGMEGVCLCQR